MNLKALALGALVGFLAAVVPACGPQEKKCDAATCTGCCDANDACVTPANTNAACGASGLACTACAANQVCSGGVCVNTGGSDAGTVCNATTCPTGCCAGTNPPVCLLGNSKSNCGTGGAACVSCNTDQTCTNQVCTTPDAGGGGVVGIACSQTSDCTALGTGAECRQSTATGAGTYTGGYCTRVCTSDADCGGGTCINAGNYDEPNPICTKKCSSSSDCRSPGYECYDIGEPEGICWLDPLPEVDAGPPADKVGLGCTIDTDCQNPPDDGFCIPETTEDGGTTSYLGGYCSAPCNSNDHCSTDGGAICITFDVGGGNTFSMCQQVCGDPGTGVSTCRANYVCQGYQIYQSDGGIGPSPDGICTPNCNNQAGSCGTTGTCLSTGYCQ